MREDDRGIRMGRQRGGRCDTGAAASGREPPTLGGAPRITQQQLPAKSTLIITTPGSQRFALALSPSRTSPKAVDHTDVQRCRLVVQLPLHTESVARTRPHPATTRAGPAECNLTAKPARKKALKDSLCAAADRAQRGPAHESQVCVGHHVPSQDDPTPPSPALWPLLCQNLCPLLSSVFLCEISDLIATIHC